MAMKVLMFMFMFLFFNFGVSQDYHKEFELLLSFKSSIHDPSGFLSNWEYSSANFCQWHGISCNNLSHVETLDLSAKNLSGKLNSSSIFHLPYIQTLNLSSNQFYGEIPQDLFSSSSSSLVFLNLSNNNFTGQIPSGSISRLETLDLSNNVLSGKIPQEIGSFYSLKFLDLGGNVLSGKIPISISNITTLQFLTLASNQLVGPIPLEIGQMKNLKWIYFGYNNLSGEIPKEIGMLNSLNHLDLVYNNLTGQIPSSIGNLTNLQYLFLYQNKLTGSIPDSIFGLKKLVSLDLSDNSLSGEIPELIIQLQNLEILHLFSNSFSGKIPNALTSLPRLQVLQLWSNRFSGEIPKSLGRHNNLTILDLSTNNLTGRIPDGICSSGLLFKLILFSNSLQGVIPRNLSSCKSLQRVRLQNNHLSGQLPSEFTKLPLVYYLDVSNNNLSGKIGEQKWEMPSLEMLNLAGNRFSGKLPGSFGSDKIEDLDLSGNGFSGSIPPSFGSLTELMQLTLCGNKLNGEIPGELSSCKKLVSLDLSHNQLSGQIPSGFSEMPVLGQLDLSVNQLSGQIPPELGKLESLVQVNISHNHLHGTLPSTGAFLAINATAVAGNDLCGGDETSGLPPCKKVIKKNPANWWFFIACSLAALVLLSIAAFGLVFIRGRNYNLELKRVENEDGMWELQFFDSKVSKSVSISDIILSTTNEANVISRGKQGMSFKGKSSVNDLEFVVKEMKDVRSIPSSFWSEITQFGKLRHPNIVKLIGICRSDKGAYLVYEFIQGKILSDEVLHNLSWERRRKIAVGIAKALQFLHSRCLLIGDMSPKRIIIDGKDKPRLRLSLPGLVCIDNKRFISSAAYVAPEGRESKEITEKSDIYGFGLILIELLTGKSPADAEFGVHQSMVEWARYCYSDCHLDMWVDPMIKPHIASNNYQNQIVETMNLALHCTAGDPTARPCAGHVSKTLESAFRITSCVPAAALKFSSSSPV
ncbi:hypothetical protein CCACVL1_05034 [Corchorus capsularis]|uniref:non-specific serine/threonine protein kinase n=1 Tax=Corchorus capsularis TaxID=210143 RepID=A0A1R3JN04_COCAP|nr:hypothetical protein CCACVL1_05034 [Corchorus capsularis]